MAVSIVVSALPGAVFRDTVYQIDLMLDAVSITRTSTLFVSTPDPVSGLTWRVTGTGLTYTGTELTGGTITGIEYRGALGTLWTISGLSLKANGLDAASSGEQVNDLEPLVAPEFDGADTLTGGAGGDLLRGFGGLDQISGGGGNDSIYAGDGGSMIEAGTGHDLVISAKGGDTIFGGAGNDSIWAGSSHDLIYGDAGVDQIDGEGGRDTLDGGADIDIVRGGDGKDWLFVSDGEDTLVGGTGKDRFYLKPNGDADAILDFVVGSDKLVLDSAIFGLPAGKLPASRFHFGSAAQDADDRIIYSSGTGIVWWDADGSGSGAAIALVDLVGVAPFLKPSDFLIE